MKNDLAGLDGQGLSSHGQSPKGHARKGSQASARHGLDGIRPSRKGLSRTGSPGLVGPGSDVGKGSGQAASARQRSDRLGLEGSGSIGPDRQGGARTRSARAGTESLATGAPSGAPTYQVREGRRIPKKHAAALAAAMVELQQAGGATAEALLDVARDASSPIHDCFEWDNKKAAHEYRLEQARYYWRSIEIVVRVDDSTEKTQRAFHPVFIDGERQYQDIGTIAQSQTLMAQLLDAAKRDLIAFKNRYAMISDAAELAGVFAAIDAMRGEDAA